jgi:hypothetical protein
VSILILRGAEVNPARRILVGSRDQRGGYVAAQCPIALSISPCQSVCATLLFSEPRPARMFRVYSSDRLKSTLHELCAGNVSRFFGRGSTKEQSGMT